MVYAFQVASLLLMILSKVHRGLPSDGEVDNHTIILQCCALRARSCKNMEWCIYNYATGYRMAISSYLVIFISCIDLL